MSETQNAEILAELDAARRSAGVAAEHGEVVREFTADGSECRIVYSRLAEGEAEEVVRAEQALAREGGYTLEWKVYGHDVPSGLGALLVAAGFEPDDEEQVLVLPVDEAALAAFDTDGYDVRRVQDESGLDDYAEIAREIGRKNPEGERQQLALLLREAPEAMSVHIAYVDGEPVSCGRVYFQDGTPFAELAGGRTKTTHRERGLFSAVVGARLKEARERGRSVLVTDALPTSEPILRKRGFRVVTSTTPYVYEPEA
ncbi:GNAT family N-acetyltransferase [Kitasatospora sp. NPDC058162]|uniref:GNAT family N-acetyltransferase n=1 Tax=Kitasatospora sp. NPDC058162 TaxID=3346362 RepID=UPI0036DBF5A8